MTMIWFIRHGKASALQSGDPGLGDIGRAEANATARWLAERRVSDVFSSPLRRARETAEILAAAHGLEVELAPRLRERVDRGDDERQSDEDFRAMWERCTRERDWVPPVGDSSRGAGRRLEAFVDGMRGRESEVVAVTHGGVLADFLRNVFTPSQLERANAAFAADPYDGEVVRPCSITSLRVEGRDLVLGSLAAIGHLPESDR